MGNLSFLNGKFYFHASSDLERQTALQVGLKFDAETLRWVTRNFDKARRLRMHADGSAERKLKNHFITDLSAPKSIIYPNHLAPHSWQIESTWHILTRTPSYVADEAGLGKSATATMAVNTVPGKTLITCPPFLKYNWLDEVSTWGVAQLFPGWLPSVSIIESVESDFDKNILVLPDSLLARTDIQSLLRKHGPFKWGIADEFHRFKTEDAQRSEAFISISELCERLVFLSGTPMPNGKPIELHPSLSRLAPESIGHRDLLEFGKTFCAAKRVTRYEGKKAVVNWDFSGASNLKQLRRELRAKLMIRHLKKNCLKELGPKSRRLIFLDQPKKILDFEKKHLAHLELSDLIGEGAKLGDLATYRKEVGLAKIKPALEYITYLLENTKGKLVVNAYHIEVVEALASRLTQFGALKIRGGMTAKMKQAQVKAFQTDPARRVVVGNTLAMGLGNTLTEAHRGVSVEPEWTPGVNEQMEDRIHRITQKHHVMWDYLVLRNSLDERMLRQALGKENNIQKVMN